MLASRWYRKGEDVEHVTGPFSTWFERGFGRLQAFYGRTLDWALNHRWFVFILGNIAVLMVFAFIAGGFSPTPGAAMSGMLPMFFIKAAILVGVILFIGHLIKGRFLPKVLVSAVMFALLFPAAPPPSRKATPPAPPRKCSTPASPSSASATAR